jgi:hypothetical protein
MRTAMHSSTWHVEDRFMCFPETMDFIFPESLGSENG